MRKEGEKRQPLILSIHVLCTYFKCHFIKYFVFEINFNFNFDGDAIEKEKHTNIQE